jgi:hypothetical protein
LTFIDPAVDKIIGKKRRKKKFVMPNWTLDELLDANSELELAIPE